ncbi:MAG: ABC transporter substrate-binding protein [Ancrocorticia sp.]|uniref:ABC transporter substrate-binding protein n=1 Tax=Ancrocorticia sp. TaxID=2593684 RepID=UPI003F93DE9E
MDSEGRSPDERWMPTRRSVLGGAALLGVGVMLTACAGGQSGGPTQQVTGPPQKGGTLRVGFVGGGASDTLDGALATNLGDIARAINMYNTLLYRDDDYELQPMLATSVTPNADATVWTAQLRDDVKFWDGRPMTADDVVASIERIVDPDDPKAGAAGLSALDKAVSIDDYTVEFRLSTPDSALDDTLGQYMNTIVPADFDPQNPVGTGPFMLDSFTPAQSTVLKANPHYWGEEGPYLDTLELLNFNDTDALINALLSSQVDVVAQIPAALSEVIASDTRMNILDSETGMWLPFTMRTDVAPFDDERVRRAFRLVVDREQMINQVLSGYGQIGNDMYAPYDPAYPDLPQRTQDIDEAKRLLSDAGYPDGLAVELVTAPIQAGVVEAAQVYAEQAAKAGITVTINRMDLTTYWGGYLEYAFSQSFWYTRNFLPQANQGSMPDSPFNETHWDDEEFIDLIEQARGETNDDARGELIVKAQSIMYERGSLIIWGFANQLDAYQSYVGGLVPNTTGLPLSGFQLQRVWIGELS